MQQDAGDVNQLWAASSLSSLYPSSVKVAGVDLPDIRQDIKVLGVILDRRLTSTSQLWHSYAAITYRRSATLRHLLTTDLFAQTLASNPVILSRINYYNAVLHCSPSGTIQNAERIVRQAPRRSHAAEGTAINQCSNCIGCQWSSASACYKLAFN